MTIRFWLNAFIPRDIFHKDGSLRSRARPNHPDQTMLPGPSWFNDCFSTDNRGFSDDPKASSRMHSELVITFRGGRFTSRTTHRCDQTREYDCEDGDLEGSAYGSTVDMAFSAPRAHYGRPPDLLRWVLPDLPPRLHTFTTRLRAAANNPLFSGSPNIDYEGQVTCFLTAHAASLTFAGSVDEFPAFEAYATLNDGLPKTLLQRLPPPGNSPADLFGGPPHSVSGSAQWLL